MSKQPKPNRRVSKVRPVPIAQMRVAPVHITQRPFKPAWGKHLAANLELNELGFPVINFRDGVYWIIDGQHRIFALKENDFGNDVVDCEVYENLTDQEAAGIFLGRNNSKSVSSFDKFHVACTAGNPRETAVRRAVETQGIKIGRAQEDNTLSAVGAVLKTYDKAGGGNVGEVVVGQVVRTIKNGLGGDCKAFDRYVIEGLGLVFCRYNGRTNEKNLASALSASQHGTAGLIRRAKSQHERTGNQLPQCMASTIVEVYNKQASKAHKLPSWWKEAE